MSEHEGRASVTVTSQANLTEDKAHGQEDN